MHYLLPPDHRQPFIYANLSCQLLLTSSADDILREIRRASIIIADVTGKNPNVNYELGAAHALGKPTIILSQTMDDVPFDYRHWRIIVYNTADVGWDLTLKSTLEKTVQNVLYPRLTQAEDGYYTAKIGHIYPPVPEQRPGSHVFYRLEGLIAGVAFPDVQGYVRGENHWLANWQQSWKDNTGAPKIFHVGDTVRFRISKISSIEQYHHTKNARNIYVKSVDGIGSLIDLAANENTL